MEGGVCVCMYVKGTSKHMHRQRRVTSRQTHCSPSTSSFSINIRCCTAGAAAAFWRSHGATSRQVRAHLREALRRERRGESVSTTLYSPACLSTRLAHLQELLQCGDDTRAAVAAASRKPSIMCYTPDGLARNMLGLKRVLIRHHADTALHTSTSATSNRSDFDAGEVDMEEEVGEYALQMVRHTPSLLERDPESLSRNVSALSVLLPERQRGGSVVDYVRKAPTLLHLNSDTLAAKKERLAAYLCEDMDDEDGNEDEEDAISSSAMGEESSDDNGELHRRRKEIKAEKMKKRVDSVLRKECRILTLDVELLRNNVYCLCHELGLGVAEGKTLAIKQPILMYQDADTIADKVASLRNALPGADVTKIACRAPSLLGREAASLAASISRLRAMVFPNMSEDRFRKMIEASPTLLAKRTEYVAEQMEDLRALFNAKRRCDAGNSNDNDDNDDDDDDDMVSDVTEFGGEDEEEEFSVEKAVASLPTLLSQNVQTTRTKLDAMHRVFEDAGATWDAEIPDALTLARRQPSLLIIKTETLATRLDGLWTHARRLDDLGYSKWMRQMHGFMSGEKVASLTTMLRMAPKRQDDRLGVVCSRIASRIAEDEEGDFALELVPGITTLMACTETRFKELCTMYM